jgi:putative transposase
MGRQLEMKLPCWGGRRRGAGRKPNGARAGVSHLARPRLAARFPVHVTLRVRREVWNLRSRRCFAALKAAFAGGRERFGFRLNQFSVQGNHLHLIIEARDATALSRGMQGLAIRMARQLNRTMRRKGRVFADRYHSRILRTPTEVKRALRYVLENRAHHLHRRAHGVDACSSAAAASCALTARPITWLLRRATSPP